jgi:hypothetical protein
MAESQTSPSSKTKLILCIAVLLPALFASFLFGPDPGNWWKSIVFFPLGFLRVLFREVDSWVLSALGWLALGSLICGAVAARRRWIFWILFACLSCLIAWSVTIFWIVSHVHFG